MKYLLLIPGLLLWSAFTSAADSDKEQHHMMDHSMHQAPVDKKQEESVKQKKQQSQSMEHEGHAMPDTTNKPQPHMHGDVSHYESVADDVRANMGVKLDMLKTSPKSGKAREAGYDGRYVMESTHVTDPIDQLCAKGTRGLMMLDNAQWEQCGGKPKMAK